MAEYQEGCSKGKQLTQVNDEWEQGLPGDPAVKTSSPSAGGKGLIPHAVEQPKKKQNIKQREYCNKFNKDFKNGPHQKKL